MTSHPVRDEILHLLASPPEGLWHGGPSVLRSLDDVPARMASWDPGSGLHSIWELSLHMAYWKYAVRQRIQGLSQEGFPRSPDNFPTISEPFSEKAWSRDRQLLQQEETALVELVKTLDEHQLQAPCTGGYRVADQLFGIAMHDVHHVAQVLLIKKLWAHQHSQDGKDDGDDGRENAHP